MTRVRARLIGVVLFVALLTSGSGFARVTYMCRMSGFVGRACCCSEHREKADLGVSTLRQSDCCRAIVAKAADRALFEPPAGMRIPPPVLAAPPPFAATPSPRVAIEGFTPERSRGPPANGPPLYIKHCSLLG